MKKVFTRLKHLRGRHNQLDHAWNRGMGQGGGGALAPNQMGPLPTENFYRKRKIELMNQVRSGEITQTEMRNELSQLRGITQIEPTQTAENNLTLANRSDETRGTPWSMSFIRKSKNVSREMRNVLTEYATRKPRKWTLDDVRKIMPYLPFQFSKITDAADLWKGLTSLSRLLNDDGWYAKQWENLGLTPDDIISVCKSQKNAAQPTLRNILALKIQEKHHELAKAITDFNVTDEDQNAAYKQLVAQIKNRGEINSNFADSREFEEYEAQTSDCEAVMALALYGNPDLRLKAIQFLTEEAPNTYRLFRQPNGKYAPISPVLNEPNKSITETAQYYSLEYRLYRAQKKQLYSRIMDAINRSRIRHSFKIPKNEFEIFMFSFFYTHTSQTTSNVLGAAIQEAMTLVGPNRNVPDPVSHYPVGINPPRPHPLIVQYLQKHYENTQRKLNPIKNTLYRGVRKFTRKGIPMAPWSVDERIARGFATGPQARLNVARMPNKYIFAFIGDGMFISEYESEIEFLILETAAFDPVNGIPISDPDTDAEVKWSIKSIRNTMINDNPQPIISKMALEANGIFDQSIISIYEPQYDIFYNYYTDDNTQTTDINNQKEKSIYQRIDNLYNRNKKDLL